MIINIIAGILGVIFSLVWKMQSLQALAQKANVEFVYSKYFQKDALSIILSFLSVAIWQVLFPEITNKYPQIEGFLRCTFFLMGCAGAAIIQKTLGRTQGWINSIVDKKTDIADGKTDAT